MLDTGASWTLLGWRDASVIFGIDRESPGVEAGGMVGTFDGARMPASKFRFHTLDIGGIAFHDPQVLLTEQHQMGAETRGSAMSQAELDRPTLVLGMSELTKLHLYIAYGERVLYVTPAKAGY
jgi:predicted aspartyl protease